MSKVCKRGHIGATRYKSGQCSRCAKDAAAEWKRNNIAAAKASRRKYKKKHPEIKRYEGGRSQAILRSALCDCCTRAEFLAVYKAAIAVRGEVHHRLELHLGGKHCVKNLHILAPEILDRKEVTLGRHIRWRETALKLMHMVLEGGSAWPELTAFVEQSETRVVAQ